MYTTLVILIICITIYNIVRLFVVKRHNCQKHLSNVLVNESVIQEHTREIQTNTRDIEQIFTILENLDTKKTDI